MTRRGSVTATLLAVLLMTTGCAGDDPAADGTKPSPSASESSADPDACQEVTTRLLAAVQRYVDGYGAPLSSGTQAPSSQGDDTEIRDALAESRAALQSAGCDLQEFGTDFKAGLEKVTARGPLAEAVKLRLAASMTGTLGSTPQTVTIRPGEDLAKAVAALAPGSTAQLQQGTYTLRKPLVLLAGITVRGQGRAQSTINSTAGGSALLVLTDGRVELRDLTVRHSGRAPASVLVGGPSSSVVLTSARLTGGRSAKKTAGDPGGSGVTMTARQGDTSREGTTLEVTRSDISGNDAAGILLTGGHRASIRGTRFAGNGQCGVCFAGVSSGAVRDSTFTDNAVGVAVLDQAQPLIADNTFRGGQVGVQVSGQSTPDIRRARISGVSRAGMIFSENAAGRVDRARCTGVPYGIVIGPKSVPFLGKNQCMLAEGQ